MGNPFSSGSGSNNVLQGLATLAPGGGASGKSGGGGGVGGAGNQGLLGLFQSLMQKQQQPGLYVAPMDKEVATAPEQATQMNAMQPPAYNPNWGSPQQPQQF